MTIHQYLLWSILCVAVAVLVLTKSSPSLATGQVVELMTAADEARLKNYETVRREAISEAKAGGTREDLEILENVLAGTPQDIHNNFNVDGKWKCRTLKLGGLLPLTVYPPFTCRFTADDAGLRLEKLTGSQRTSGRFFDDGETRLIYLGALHYSDEKPKAYGTDPERDQIAYGFWVGKNRIRLEFPSPKYESKLDILELYR